MKIVRIHEYMFPWLGGSSANEYYLSKELAHLGHDVILFTSDIAPGRYLDRKKYQKTEEQVDGFKVVRSPAILNLGGDMPIMPNLLSKMKETGGDLIHAHEYYNYTSLIAYFVAKREKIPFTYTQERYYWIKRKAWSLPFWLGNKTLLKAVCKSPKRVTAFSEAAKEFLASQDYPFERIHVIPMGVDTSRFKSTKDPWFRQFLRIEEETPIVLSVARLHASKNLNSLLRAMALVNKTIKEAKLIVIGRGPQENFLRKMAINLGLKKSTLFISDPIPYEKMPSVYNSCDVFVLPSLYEPFGMAVPEAMSCGVPVIVSDAGGMRDTVVDGETGFKVSLRNGDHFVKILSTRIITLLKDEKLKKSMGLSAIKRVRSFYDWKVVAKKYEEFYEKLLAS
ncbi:MAG: glycosyltransferase family 4 protein [Candidatus Bathyarchaeota archaeon]|nr:MAG: glycosyltransferase family 4 protein [Candidatus Bathyarchaeota archaeon]